MVAAARTSRRSRGALALLALALALATSAWGAGLPDLIPSGIPASARPGGTSLPDLGSATRLIDGLLTAPAADRLARPAQVSGTADWSTESNLANRKLGMAVTPAGDVNGDGFSDFVALGDVNSFHTALYLYLGSATGATLAPGYPAIDLPPGAQVSAAGDVNGNGLADIVLYWADTGTARVYFGTSGGLDLVSFNQLSGHFGANVFGFNAAPAGDVNGDGFDDLIFGMPFQSGFSPCSPSPGSGVVEVLYGSLSGVSATNNWYVEGCLATSANAGLGTSVAGAGDVNGDGFDDIVIGAPGADPTFSGSVVGIAYVMYGSISGFPTINGFPHLGTVTSGTAIAGHHLFAEFGNAVSPVGDLNGDGYADIAIGAPSDDNYGTDGGMAFVFRGSAAGIDTATADLLWSEAGGLPSLRFGQALTPAGDVNGDGRGDLLIAMSSGVALGQSTGSTLIISQTLGYPPNAHSTVTAGDVTGDGLSDVLVGDPFYANGESAEGRVLVHYGTGSPPSYSANWSATQTAIENPNFGWSVASAGDVNADGYDDVLVGEPTWYNFTSPGDVNNGLIQLFLGSATGLATTSAWYTWGASGDQLGVSVASAGDVNGDGYADILAGAHFAAGGFGQAQLWYGGPGGPASFAPNVTITGFSAGSQFGASVAAAGDVDGDGYPDVIVGAPLGVDPTTPRAGEGRAYIFRGGSGGLSTTPLWSRSGGQIDAHLGTSVASAGDANGDSYADVIVGMPDYDATDKLGNVYPDAGRALVEYGASTGMSGEGTLTVFAPWRLGASVAGAGDVNGDGVSDVIVGAPNATNTIAGEGAARVYTGGTNRSLTTLWTQFGGEAFGGFGSAVSSAGDTDGDGLSDVLVGAVFQEAGGAHDQGAAYVFRGPLPAGAAAFWTATGGSPLANMGHSLANAGDVNGDGWSDLMFGEPGYTNTITRQGFCQVRYGSQGTALFQLGLGYHITAPGHLLQPGCLSDPGGVFLISTGRSTAGRTKVRLQYRVTPVIGLPVAGASGFTAWTATGAPAANGSLAALAAGASGLTNGVPYAWQLRTLSHSVYFPTGPWRSPVRSGRLETDFRVPGTWLAVDGGPAVSRLMLADARPNPMRTATSIGFALTRSGTVSLEVLDLQGRRVRSLARGVHAAGPHRLDWDGRGEDGAPVGAGIYFVRLEAEGQAFSRKLALLR